MDKVIESEFLSIHSREDISMARSLHVKYLMIHLGAPGAIVEQNDCSLTWDHVEWCGSGAFTLTRKGVQVMRYERGPLERDHPFPDPPPTHTELRNRHTLVGLPPPAHLPAEEIPLMRDSAHYTHQATMDLGGEMAKAAKRALDEPADTEVGGDPDARRP